MLFSFGSWGYLVLEKRKRKAVGLFICGIWGFKNELSSSKGVARTLIEVLVIVSALKFGEAIIQDIGFFPTR